jgi:hypothetical protein
MKLYKISDNLDVIPYDRAGGAPVCRCLGSGASLEQVQAAAHKFHLDSAVVYNGTQVDYNQIALGHCKKLLGHLKGDGCFVLYDKLLMSLVLMIGTFFLAITLKVCLRGQNFNMFV